MGIDKILIADDDFAFVNRLKKGLQQFSQFSILTAPDGKHALRLLSTQQISLVVTDLTMPKMDGPELLAAMTRQFPNVLSIVSTSLEKGTLVKTTLGDSLFSCLNKPYDHVALHSEIIKVLDCLDEIQFKPGIYAGSLLPLVYLCKKTCLLEMQCGGDRSGSLYFREGMLCDASQKDLTGRQAVEKMLGWPPGKYWFKELPASHTGTGKNTTLTELMLHGTGLEFIHHEQTDEPAEKPVSQSSTLHEPRPRQPAPASQESREPGASSPEPVLKEKTSPADHLIPHPRKCRVLVIDDSKIMRQAIIRILGRDESLEIAGEGNDGAEALQLVRETRPDVVTLDIKGPDSLRTLKQMMILSPTPVVIFSSLAHEGTSITFDTLKFGAVDFMAKPSNILSDENSPQLNEIIRKVHHAAGVKIESAKYVRSVNHEKKSTAKSPDGCQRIICLGAAEGGYASLLKIIPGLSTEQPVSYFVILHVTPQHVDAFINYLDNHSTVKVRRASNGLPVEGGTCYLASGREYAAIQDDPAGKLIMRVKPAPPDAGRDSINLFMLSMARKFKEKSVGILLSGSGTDGSEGIREIRNAGGTVLLSDPANCLYKDMVENIAKYIDKKNILPDVKIAHAVNKICGRDPA